MRNANRIKSGQVDFIPLLYSLYRKLVQYNDITLLLPFNEMQYFLILIKAITS